MTKHPDKAEPLELKAHWRRSHPKTSVRLARAILAEIVGNDLADGTSLQSEAAMIEHYGVGRPTLREALRVLEVLGFIEIRSGRGGGPIVRTADVDDFGSIATAFFNVKHSTYRDLVEARLVIEPMVARAVALGDRAEEAGDELLAIIKDAQQRQSLPDTHFSASAGSFHVRLYEFCDNPIIRLFVGSLRSIWFDRLVGETFPDDERHAVHDVHEDIAHAIRDGDADRAQMLSRQHMERMLAFSVLRHPGFLGETISW